MTELNLTSVMLKLHDYNITGILFYYEGSGDSGSIERIAYTQAPVASIDELKEVFEDDPWQSKFNFLNFCSDEKVINEIEDFLSDTVTNLLLDTIEDWWNDDGGYGSVTMLVPSGKYDIENNVRFTNTDLYKHEGNFFDKL